MKRKPATGRPPDIRAWPKRRHHPVRFNRRLPRGQHLAPGRSYEIAALLGARTLAERPPQRIYPPEEAQALLGGLVRRLAKLKALLEEIRDGLPVSPEEDRMLEAEIPSDLATELRGMIGCSLDDDLGPAIERLTEAAALTAADLEREFEERKADRQAAKRLFAAVAPRVAEILEGGAPKPPRRPRTRRKDH